MSAQTCLYEYFKAYKSHILFPDASGQTAVMTIAALPGTTRHLVDIACNGFALQEMIKQKNLLRIGLC